MNCVACGAPLDTPLATFGDLDAPMCQACHLGLMGNPDPYAVSFFWYQDAGDGWQFKRLTEAGAVYLGGQPDQVVMKVKRYS